MTITRFENGHSKGYPDPLRAIRTALEQAGVHCLDNGTVAAGAGVALKAVTDGGKSPDELNASNDG